MKVINMEGRSGKPVANQFIVEGVTIKYTTPNGTEGFYTGTMFQSYKSNIAFRTNTGSILLDSHYWDYSTTTGKYRNQFLNEGIAETRKRIKSGEYILTDLNK